MTADAGAELVEVLDAEGDVVRVVTRREMRAQRLRHRSVYIAVLDSRGRLLVHQRSFEKDFAPGAWDIAAGGVCAVGESAEEAARRELAEELGCEAALEWLGRDSYTDAHVDVVGDVYLARSDGPFRFDDGEVIAARFVTAAELDVLRRQQPFCADSLALVLPLLTGRFGGR